MASINDSYNNRDSTKEPFITSPYGNIEETKNEDDYNTEDETIMGKILFPLNYIANKFKAGSLKGSIFTLITATIGTGILLIPNSIGSSGLGWGLMQMFICGFLGYYSLMLVIRSAEKAKVYSYQELAYITFGKPFRTIVNIVFFFSNWGPAIAYIILVSQLMARAFGIFFNPSSLPEWLTDPHSTWWPIIVATVFVLPLSLAKELKSLRYFCLLSFFFILFLAFVIIYESFTFVDFSANVKIMKDFDFSGTSTTFPTAIFAYLCHPNVLDVFKELHNSTKRRMRKVILRSTILVFFIYAIVGSFGYITFADRLNVLINDANSIVLFGYGYDKYGNPQSYPTITVVALIFIGLSVIVATPLCIKPAKDGLSDMFFPKTNPMQEDPIIRHTILVLITIYTGVAVGLLSSSMQSIISILGSSFFTIIAFIMPPIFYIKLSPRSKLWGHKILCWIMLVVFTAFGIWSTVESIISALQSGGL